MRFIVTFALIIATTVGVLWFIGDTPEVFHRSVVFDSLMHDEQIESIANHPVNANVTVSLSNINGSLKLTGHEHDNAVIKVTKRGNKEHFKDVKPQVTVTTESIDIHTNYEKRYDHQNVAVDYDLTLPHNAVLELVKSINGSITIDNIAGPITSQTVNGAIEVLNTQESVDVYTVNGSINLTVAKFPADKVIQATTTSGQLICTLPATINTNIYAKAAVGSITSQFKLPGLEKDFVGQEVKGVIGHNPKSSIKLNTANGSIEINKSK